MREKESGDKVTTWRGKGCSSHPVSASFLSSLKRGLCLQSIVYTHTHTCMHTHTCSAAGIESEVRYEVVAFAVGSGRCNAQHFFEAPHYSVSQQNAQDNVPITHSVRQVYLGATFSLFLCL